MSDIPETIADVGSVQQQLRRNPNFDPAKHGALTSEDYFVFTRIDGKLTAREVILETGFPLDRAIAALRKLKAAGAFLLPGERPYVPGSSASAPAQPPRPVVPADGTRPPGKKMIATPSRFEELELTARERGALAEDVSLTDDEKRSVILLLRTIERGTMFDVLGVGQDADKRELKRAYFKISKQFHPDRYYGKSIGSFGPWLSRIFETASRAFDVLSDDGKREAYRELLSGKPQAPARARAQTQQEHAAELFDRACKLEAQGERIDALTLFAGILRIDPQLRYMSRAARCALDARQLSLAEEYAKKATGLQPDDPSAARLLASVYRASGKLTEAEQVLERALSLNPHNDHLHHELTTDLAAVRTDLGKQR